MDSKINAERLNKYIEQSGLKKSYIAEQMGTIPPRLSEKLHGRVFMYPHELMGILEILGIDEEQMRNERLTDWYLLPEATPPA